MRFFYTFLPVALLALPMTLISDAQAEVLSSEKAVKTRTPDELKKIQEIRDRVKKKRDVLNGSSWQISFKPAGPGKTKPFQDTFIFQDGQMRSEAYEKRGFSTTSYTVSVSPDPSAETAVWETMKTGKEGMIFIRGEWEKGSMQGSVTEQLDGGKKVFEYYFTSDATKAIAKSSEKMDEPKQSGEATESNLDGAAAPLKNEGASLVSEGSSLVSKETVQEVMPFEPGTTTPVTAAPAAAERGSLVSKEAVLEVTPFEPGTTLPAAGEPVKETVLEVVPFEPGTTQEKSKS